MILKGDCIEVMKAIKPNSVDAIVTDPPYNLHFMDKDWDKDLLHEKWLIEAYRVLKPGGSMLVMGGTRTSHRLACAIEDTGFIIKDTLMYLYGSGFPKAQSLDGLLEKKYGKQATKYCLRCLSEANLSKTLSVKKAERKTLQSGLSKQGLQGNGKERAKPKIANGEQSCMEGRSYLFQEEGKLSEYQICQSSKMGNSDGEKRRVHNDSSPNNSKTPRPSIRQGGSSSSPRPQSKQQRNIESNAICLKCGTQIIRGFKVGGIKPAYEPIIWAVKPPEGSYVDNVLKWGVGAVNVDECRVEWDDAGLEGDTNRRKSSLTDITGGSYGKAAGARPGEYNGDAKSPKGRFPANVILSHHPDCVQVGMKRVRGAWSNKGVVKNKRIFNANLGQNIPVNKDKYYDPDGYETVESWDCHPDCAVRLLDEQSGVLKSGARDGQISKPATNVYGKYKGKSLSCESSSGGASRFFKQCNYGQEEWLCHENCALRQLDEQSGKLGNAYRPKRDRNKPVTAGIFGADKLGETYPDNGGASRFFYCAKASRGERNAGLEGMEEKACSPYEFNNDPKFRNPDGRSGDNKTRNNHPTVKPIKLFEYLIKLVTREGQIVLDPFIGSGTTAIAVHNTGRKCVGIEKEEEYIEIAKRRTAYWRSRPRQLEMIGG